MNKCCSTCINEDEEQDEGLLKQNMRNGGRL